MTDDPGEKTYFDDLFRYWVTLNIALHLFIGHLTEYPMSKNFQIFSSFRHRHILTRVSFYYEESYKLLWPLSNNFQNRCIINMRIIF